MRRRVAPAVLLVALLVGACTYSPMIPDIGGIRIRPENARAVLQPSGLAVSMDLAFEEGRPDRRPRADRVAARMLFSEPCPGR